MLTNYHNNCKDVNECLEAALRNEEICGSNGQCQNTEGSFECTYLCYYCVYPH